MEMKLEKCNDFYDLSQIHHAEKLCQPGEWCCGPCESRHCCSLRFYRIANQSDCDILEQISQANAAAYILNTAASVSISLESIIEIIFLILGFVIIVSFVYLKIRERLNKQNVLIVPRAPVIVGSNDLPPAYSNFEMDGGKIVIPALNNEHHQHQNRSDLPAYEESKVYYIHHGER